MTPDYRTHLLNWLKGHLDACQFIEDCFQIFHTVDDLVDKDHEVTTKDLIDRFQRALITVPRNPFYQQYFAILNPLMQQAITNWEIANAMEVSDQANSKEIAFILRSSYNDLITMCAEIIGGHAWAIHVGMESRYHAAQEGFELYRIRLTAEHREGV